MISGGIPGNAPRWRSSNVGLRAEVSAIDSPSHPKPLLSHSTWMG
jgi:hypothetical protein